MAEEHESSLLESVRRLETAQETPEFEPIWGDIWAILGVLQLAAGDEPAPGKLSRVRLVELLADAEVMDEYDHPQVLTDTIRILCQALRQELGLSELHKALEEKPGA